MTQPHTDYDTIVVGGGPSGATAAHELANKGHRVLLLERGSRIKPCGGAIPPCLLQEFNIPDHLVVARLCHLMPPSPASARAMSPKEGATGSLLRPQLAM